MRAGRSVRQPMTNARIHRLQSGARSAARRHTIAKRARAANKMTSVMVPMIGWQQPGPLFIKHQAQQQQLKRVLTSAAHRPRPISIGVHGQKCPLSIFVLPLIVDVDDFVSLNDCVNERDERCTCTPVIMYTGAKA